MTVLFRKIDHFYIADAVVVTGDVIFGTDVNVWFGCVVRGDLATIRIGDRVNLQDGVIVHTDFGKSMTIDPDVVVGHGAILHGDRIGRDTLIGMGARLLSGSEIGEECLIAAGALVTEGQKIPPRSVAMGVPAKIIRPITDEEIERTREIRVHYLEMAQRYVRGEFPPPWLANRPPSSTPSRVPHGDER